MQLQLFPSEANKEPNGPVNVASVPQRSPFRYPGGKTWLVPIFRNWIESLGSPPSILIEPFAGGGIIGLTAAFEGLARKVLLVELDARVAAVWKTMLNGQGSWLADAILQFDLNPKSAADMLATQPASLHELALQTIVRNRTAHGGILAEGAGVIKAGEGGKGILSRWYPKTLASRIYAIQHIKDRIAFEQSDAFQVLSAHQENPTAAFFVDPPYTVGGKSAGSRLYTHSVINHDELFSICSKLKGRFLMTYDNAPEVVALANKYGFETQPVSMKNTHHAEMKELLISRDFGWMK
jgi:DNA adenine methylase